jgi:probable phosphoglycerate mutase
MQKIQRPDSGTLHSMPSRTAPPQSALFAAPKAAEGEAPAAKGDWISAHCDGGARGNPGPAGFGVYIQSHEGMVLAELSEFIGFKTNNVAEYSGLLAALDFALQNGHPRLRVVSDSELMVKQIQGKYKVASPDLRPLFDEAKRRIAKLEAFQIEHALRAKNKHADRLANLAMDRGMGRSPKAGAPTSATPYPKAEKPLKGFVKDGVVHLLEGELPNGVFVTVQRTKQD